MRYVLLICLMACIGSCNNKATTGDGQQIVATPGCIKEMITKFEKEPKQNPPRKIFRYGYKEKIVYYVPAICCDMYSDLYSSDCKLLGHPDGGFTGKGDGTLPDFDAEKTAEHLVWQDKR